MARLVRCSARRRDGQPCRRWASADGAVCSAHAGSVSQVKAAARRATGPDLATVARLSEMLEDAQPPMVQLRAVREVFSIMGLLNPRSVLDLRERTPDTPVDGSITDTAAEPTVPIEEQLNKVAAFER